MPELYPDTGFFIQAGRLGDQRNYVLPKLNNLNNIENDIKRVQFTAQVRWQYRDEERFKATDLVYVCCRLPCKQVSIDFSATYACTGLCMLALCIRVPLLQDICTARVQQSLAKEEACQAAYVAAIAAAFTEKVEAKQRKQAAIKQAKIACEQQKKAAKKAARKEYQRKVTEADASADSCQAEELTRARQLYKDAVLASGTKPQETIQALAAARLEVERRRTEEEQVCSSQEKCMSQLMSLLNTARGTDQVGTCQESSCIALQVYQPLEFALGYPPSTMQSCCFARQKRLVHCTCLDREHMTSCSR